MAPDIFGIDWRSTVMTARERLAKALRFEAPDRPPHFEQMFELTEEAFGLSFPSEAEIDAAAGAERARLFDLCAEIYARTAERFGWDAVLVWRPAMRTSAQYEFIPVLKKRLGPDIPVGSFIWDGFISIDVVKDYMQFAIDLKEEPEEIDRWARTICVAARVHAQKLIDSGCDLIDIASDFAFNKNTFISPKDFARFVTPYVKDVVEMIRRQGVFVILHSDGYLIPVLDQILEIGPHALQSIDPMAGMDIAKVKEATYGKIALMGNVQCSLLQDGPDEAIRASALYCLEHGSPGGGYIFSSSNTIFTGLPLANYDYMLSVFREFNEGDSRPLA
jgi:uroporphyrinogen decarboxylase